MRIHQDKILAYTQNISSSTFKGLQAKSLGGSWVLSPLEDQKSLIDVGKGVRWLELDGLIETLQSLIVLLLVQQKFSIVVVDIARLGEVLECLLENVHGL